MPSDPLQIHLDIRLSPFAGLPARNRSFGALHIVAVDCRNAGVAVLFRDGAGSCPAHQRADWHGLGICWRVDRSFHNADHRYSAGVSQSHFSLGHCGVLGPSLPNLLLAFVLVWWAGYARIIRGLVLQIKERDYIRAARASGATHLQIVLRHIICNAARPMLVLASLEIGAIMLAIAGLSFLGLGHSLRRPNGESC